MCDTWRSTVFDIVINQNNVSRRIFSIHQFYFQLFSQTISHHHLIPPSSLQYCTTGTKNFLEIDQEKAHWNQLSQRLTKTPKHYKRVRSSILQLVKGQSYFISCKLEVSVVAPNMIKLSVNETKWSNLLPGPVLLLSSFWFRYLISVPKSYWDFREICPWDNTTL